MSLELSACLSVLRTDAQSEEVSCCSVSSVSPLLMQPECLSNISFDESPELKADSNSAASLDHSSSLEKPPVSRRQRGKPEFTVEQLMSMPCCGKKHVTCFKKITQESIEKMQTKFYSISEVQQNQYMLDYMIEHGKSDKSILYVISGEEVCERCWRLVYGVRYNRLQSIKNKYISNAVIIEHGLTGRLKPSESTLRLQCWLRSFFQKVGDRMPMADALHLPSCLTKCDVYELARDDLTQGGLECPSISQMYNIWTKEFKNVKIPKENRFSKCNVCSAIKEAKERTLNVEIRKWLAELMEKHMQLQITEREKYLKHRRKAVREPSKYMSLIIDGMDQQKTSVPHIISNPKAMAGSFILDTHVTGIRVHGRKLFMAIDCNDFPHDSNLTIELLLRVLIQFQESLPRVLYIQMDNTCRDNKNRYTLVFAHLLVHYGIFEKVKIGFLPVGHTHEDIDQAFSCVSRKLQHTNALTISDLMKVIKTSFSPEPEFIEVDQVHDMKEWMMPCVPPLHDHLKAHLFKFERGEKGIKMYYKEWSSDKFWLPNSGINLLSGHSAPELQDPPRILLPMYDSEDLRKLEVTISKLSAYLEKAGANKWWQSWLSQAHGSVSPKTVQDTGNWTMKLLASKKCEAEPIPKNNPSILLCPSTCSMSGVEMESPHVVLAAEKERTYEIPGVGNISTLWIGHMGRDALMKQFALDIETPKISELKKELRTLASVCLKALDTIPDASKSEVKAAVDLCRTYVPKASRRIMDNPISRLWKEEAAPRTLDLPEDKIKLATQVLGEPLVDIITEKKSEPPHIYVGNRRGKQDVLQNRDIVKDLNIGMFVAVPQKSEIPDIGKVSFIPPNASIDSTITITLWKQEKAPHKPRWYRYFYQSEKQMEVKMADIILYDFMLTNNGAIRKTTREYFLNYSCE